MLSKEANVLMQISPEDSVDLHDPHHVGIVLVAYGLAPTKSHRYNQEFAADIMNQIGENRTGHYINLASGNVI